MATLPPAQATTAPGATLGHRPPQVGPLQCITGMSWSCDVANDGIGLTSLGIGVNLPLRLVSIGNYYHVPKRLVQPLPILLDKTLSVKLR